MSETIFIRREVGPLACNCYVVGDAGTREAVVIDPGGDAEELIREIASEGLTITKIVATHAHFDHVIAAGRLREVTGAPFLLHPGDETLLGWMRESGLMFLGMDVGDPPEVDSEIKEGDEVAAGSLKLDVLHTPGHSPGSISLVGRENLFAGDTLFAGSIGRTDLPGGDGATLVTSVRRGLFVLPDDLVVRPGHGPPTTIATERATNPFVGDGAPGI